MKVANRRDGPRPGRLAAMGLALVLLFVFCASGLAEERVAILVSEIIESFDDDPTSRWFARGSKFTTKEYDRNGNAAGVFPKVAEAEAYPSALFGLNSPQNEDGQMRKVLGIYGKFDRRGYNYIEIIPGKPAESTTPDELVVYEDINTDTKWQHAPMDIPGEVKYFDLWVWGANYNYYLEAHFEDYRGITHAFHMANLNYAGWKNLRITIPSRVPQAAPYIPRFKPLRFTKFILWTRPEERVSGFYVYLDQIKILTDIFIERFDGDDLADVEVTNKVWGSK